MRQYIGAFKNNRDDAKCINTFNVSFSKLIILIIYAGTNYMYIFAKFSLVFKSLRHTC
jgi:hypothetical protein